MELTLQFLIMVDGPLEEAGLIELIRTGVPGAEAYRRNSVQVQGNLIEVNPNEDFDPRRSVAGDEDEFLYFRWRVEATPLDAGITEDHQVALARSLVGAISGPRSRAIVCANFE